MLEQALNDLKACTAALEVSIGSGVEKQLLIDIIPV